MCITLNTYGIRSINAASFNAPRYVKGNPVIDLPLSIRDLANTVLRINNLTLNILGYIPGVKHISGCVRMGIGGTIILLTLALGTPTASTGLIIGRWYDEALLTGIAQVTRGALEAFVVFPINLIGDVAGTVCNLSTEISHASYSCGDDIFEMENTRRNAPPYCDPDYPIFLLPLYLA